MQTKPTVHVNEHIKEQKFPKTFSFHSSTAEDLKAVEYVLPYARAHFTHPEENKVRLNKAVHGAVSSKLYDNSEGKQPPLCGRWFGQCFSPKKRNELKFYSTVCCGSKATF